jgi:NCS1 family nucleobase:cation symporter-1
MTGGCLIGMLLVMLAGGPLSLRYGIDSIAATKVPFGIKGWILPAFLQSVSIIGWNSLLLIFFAKSASQLLVVLGILPADSVPVWLVPSLTLGVCAIIYVVLSRGAKGVSVLSNILVAHVFVGAWMLMLIVSKRWPELMAAAPVAPNPDRLYNYTTGVELGIATTLSWWPYLGAMIRMAPNARSAVLPVMLGMGAPVPILSLIGLAGVLVLKSSDPSEWLRTVGGPTYAVIALAFVTAANLGTAVAGIYAAALGLRNFRRLQSSSWKGLLILNLAPVAFVGAVIPNLFFSEFGSFLALIGVAFAPLCGIQIADFYVVQRRRIDLLSIFNPVQTSRYFYLHGWNPAAVVALLAGVVTYLALLNPVTYSAAGAYRYLTASLPAAAIAGLCYVVISRLQSRKAP